MAARCNKRRPEEISGIIQLELAQRNKLEKRKTNRN
jgi:hypothetical protein